MPNGSGGCRGPRRGGAGPCPPRARAARDIGLKLERRPLELGVLLGDAANLHERHRGGGVALQFPVVFSRRIEKQSNTLDSVMFLQMARLPDLPPRGERAQRPAVVGLEVLLNLRDLL